MFGKQFEKLKSFRMEKLYRADNPSIEDTTMVQAALARNAERRSTPSLPAQRAAGMIAAKLEARAKDESEVMSPRDSQTIESRAVVDNPDTGSNTALEVEKAVLLGDMASGRIVITSRESRNIQNMAVQNLAGRNTDQTT
jgi:hypothetical protein